MTSVSSQSNTLFTLMKDVSEAIRLDRNEKNEDAYRKYLECVLRCSTALLKDLHSDGGHVKITSDKLKMVKLGQQCMERVGLIVNGRFDPPVAAPSPNKPPDREKGPPSSLPISQSKPRSREITPSPSQHTKHITSPDTYKGIHSPPPVMRSAVSSMKMSAKLKKLTPMEQATHHNQQLLLAFKARQTQAAKGRHNRTVSTNLSLTLQRKMAENLAMAKAQEEILAKKMKERQQRLEEQAAKRFLTPMGLSEEEQHQRQIYRKVLEFEQEELWMIDERKKLEQSPTDITVISSVITVILSCDTHPLTEQIKLYQTKLLNKVDALVHDKTEKVGQIKVPLHSKMLEQLKTFKQSCQTKTDKTSDKKDTDKGSHDQTEDVAQISVTDKTSTECLEKFNAKDDAAITDKKLNSDDNKTILDAGNAIKDNENGRKENAQHKDIETVTIEIKDECESAISQGEKVQAKLKQENKAVTSLCRQVTDYDKYNQENMDDLFDDDDEEEEEDKSTSRTEGGNDSRISEGKSTGHEKGDEADREKDIEKDSTANVQQDDETKELEEELHECLKSVQKFTASDAMVAKLKNEAYLRHLNGITEDIVTNIEKVQVLFVIAFQELDSAEGRDQCNVLLEKFFFKPLWSSLLTLFRLANEPKELALASYMTDKQTALPQECGVRDKLCLMPVSGGEEFPYQSSVKELLWITHCPTMLEKLECLVRTSKVVLQNVEQFYKQKEAQVPDMGADDLLPVLCYVVAKSGLPQIVSECHAMDRFIHEGYMFGEEGYCLTSFQTAINYLVSQGMEGI